MKRKYWIILMMLAVMLVSTVRGVPVKAAAGDLIFGDYSYVVEAEKAVITGYHGTEAHVTLPTVLDGYTVTSLRSFMNDTVVELTIPEGITNVESSAVWNCANLTTIRVPASVTSLQSNYGYCPNIQQIIVADENTDYCSVDGALYYEDMSVFLYCPTAKSGEFVIPEGVQRSVNSLFAGCTQITRISIPSTFTNFNGGAFEGCISLLEFTVAEGNTRFSAQDGVLYNSDKTKLIKYPCGKTGDFMIPATVIEADYSAFESCNNIQKLTVEEGNTAFRAEDNFLYDYNKTALLYIPKDYTGVLYIPEGVEGIETYAMQGCEGITELYVPASTTWFGDVSYASNLKNIYVDEANPEYMDVDGVLCYKYVEEGVVYCSLMFYPCGRTESVYTIPANIGGIEGYSFMGNTYLEQLIIPDTVAYMAEYSMEENYWYDPLFAAEENDIVLVITPNSEAEAYVKYFEEEGMEYYGRAYYRYCYGHSYDSQVTTAPTCTETGVRTYTCTTETCKFTYTEPEPAAGHKYDGGKITTEPTCEKVGVKTYSCVNTGCTHSYTESLKAVGHTYDKGKVTTEPTCTAKGVKTYTCINSNCGHTYTEVIPQKEHSYVTAKTKATTGKNGSIVVSCEGCGHEKSKTVISRVKSVKLSTTNYTYSGKKKSPSVTVKDSSGKKLKKNTDYTVSYGKGRKNVGKYTVTVKLKGNYSGTVKKTFTIKPKGTSLTKVTAKKKGFKVTWKKQSSQVSGYEIQYSTSSKFTKKTTKTVKVKSYKTTSKSISKLKAKKKYYVRIRTYKTVKINGKSANLYSGWSKVKKITTKK